MMSNGQKELFNLRIAGYCLLNLETGEREYYRKKRNPSGCFSGHYFQDRDTFFALYPTEKGPFIYYKEKSHPINKELTITLDKIGKDRIFKILDYGIEIYYREDPYIDFDVWSREIDVDLFLRIYDDYKNDDFYKRYTK